jgi:hypothetical protein
MGGLGFLIDPVTNDDHAARQQFSCGEHSHIALLSLRVRLSVSQPPPPPPPPPVKDTKFHLLCVTKIALATK